MGNWWAGVGSRTVPDDIAAIQVRVGRCLTDQGWALSSGDALGSDRNFYEGAKSSPKFYHTGARIYLSWNGVGDRWHDPLEYFFNGPGFTDTWATAQAMALEARGSFERLGRGGIAHHTRNVYQIHGHTLQDLVKAIIYYAQPVGRQEKVKGGTNTALQLAIKAGVPTRINLYKEEDLRKVESFLAKNESL